MDLEIKKQSTSEEAEKRKDEYNAQAANYSNWQDSDVIMQHVAGYTTVNEMLKHGGIEGKSFLEVGCGPCPIGRRLVQKGARKVIGLDISQGMIDGAEKELKELGIRDKFELVVADIFDPELKLSEKVDYVICQYALTTFINNQDMLNAIIAACKKLINDSGVVAVMDFCYTKCGPEEKVGCFNRPLDGRPPSDFEVFDFQTDENPDEVYKVFNIPAPLMFKAGMAAGFQNINFKRAYPAPEYKDHPHVKRYLYELGGPEYIMLMQN